MRIAQQCDIGLVSSLALVAEAEALLFAVNFLARLQAPTVKHHFASSQFGSFTFISCQPAVVS